MTRNGHGRCFALRLVACAAAFAACSKRPLGPDDGIAVIDANVPAGDGGEAGGPGDRDAATGTGCLELVGTPLLVLDNPPVSGNLYTTLLWTGEEYLFVWRIFGGADILMQRIDAAGRGIGGNIRVRANESACDLAWGGARLAAVWIRVRGAVQDLMFQTFDGLGRPRADARLVHSSAGLPIDGSVSYGPRIVPIPDGFAIAFSDGSVFVTAVDFDGVPLRGPVAVGGNDLRRAQRLSLSAAGDRLVVGWNGQPATGPTPSGPPPVPVFARAFATGLTPLGDALALDDESSWTGPIQVLATADGFLALWGHSAPGDAGLSFDTDVRLAQIGASGVTATVRVLEPPVAGRYPEQTPAAWNGDHLALLWGGGGGVTLSRYRPDGAREGAPIDLLTGAGSRFYVTAHGGTLGFVWTEEIGGGYQVYFQQAKACRTN